MLFNRKTVLIAKKRDSLIESITLFSYLFCAFLFMVGSLQVVATVIRVMNERESFSLLGGLSIRSQIHGTVIFISVLSFVITPDSVLGLKTSADIRRFAEHYLAPTLHALSELPRTATAGATP